MNRTRILAALAFSAVFALSILACKAQEAAAETPAPGPGQCMVTLDVTGMG